MHPNTNANGGAAGPVRTGGGGTFVQAANSLRDVAEIRHFVLFGFGLAVCGAVSIVAATLASAYEAEKTFHLESYTNTHWITTIYLFAGLSVLLLEKTKMNFFLYLAITLCIISWPIGAGSVFADLLNLVIVVGVDWRTDKVGHWTYLSKNQLVAMVVYAICDLVVSSAALILATLTLLEIRCISRRYFAPVEDFKNLLLLCCGTILTTLSVVRLLLWIIEVIWLKTLGDGSRFLFLHYTIDEPSWICIFIITGVLTTIVAVRGTRLLMYVSVGITALGTFPALLYFWIDYRWYTQTQMAEITIHIPKPPAILVANLFIGACHLLMILVTVIVQIRYLSLSGSYLYRVHLECDKHLKQAINYGGLLVIASAAAFMISDMVNLANQSFYRVFYPTEQKLPFILLIAGVLTLFSINRNVCLFFIPAGFIALLVSAYTCVFHIAAYLFLAYNSYYLSDLCSLFFFGKKHCNIQANVRESWSHFFEALMATAVMMLCLYLAWILGRFTKLHRLKMGALALEEMRKKRICEMWITVIGISSLLAGVGVVYVSMQPEQHFFDNNHPLLIIHSVVYRTCLALALVIFPIIQIVFARDLLFYPLRSVTLCLVALMRMVDTVTQLDYRNVGQDTGAAWAVFSVVELASLAAHFATLCLAVALLDLGVNRPPRFDFVDDRPTSEEDAGRHPNGDTVADVQVYRDAPPDTNNAGDTSHNHVTPADDAGVVDVDDTKNLVNMA